MSETWETKDGRRRVRRDPPTLDDAVLAAQGMTDDVNGQVEIVMALMAAPAEAARSAVLKMTRRKDATQVTVAGRAGATRAVVVERRAPRRAVPLARASVAGRGRG